MLKDAEQGRPAQGLERARQKDPFEFAIVIDDQILRIKMPWQKVAESSESALVEFIVSHMRGEGPVLQ